MKLNLIFPLVFFACINSYGQQALCGFDETRLALSYTDPSYKQQEENVNQLLYQQAINPLAKNRSTQVVQYIPVAVHIVHMNGPENIPDSSVIAGINELNLRFQNSSPYYDSTGNNVGIQFCLASIDPSGNPTTGITRDFSTNTDITWTMTPIIAPVNDPALKNINRWDPHLYLNIWVIRNSTLYAGYATYPYSTLYANDGIVIEYTSFNSSTLAHEVGHYLGLYHTFEGGCTNTNCLLDGDRICDTPPDATTTGCSGNSCSTDMNDTSGFNPLPADVSELPNYMDYTSCALSFSLEQSNRMNASLTQLRATLLQSNGCGSNPGGLVPVASFTASSGCGTTTFTNTSSNSVGAQWDFNNDGWIDDFGNTVTYNGFPTGYHSVTMYATGYGGTDTITQTVFIQNYPSQNYPLVNGYSGLVISPTTGLFTACQGATITFQGEPGMQHYYWSNGDTTQNTTFIQDTSDFTISLTTIDSAGLSWTSCYPVHVEAAPAPIPPTITVDPNDTSFCIGDPVHLYFTYSPAWYSGNLFVYNQGNIPGFHNGSYTTTVGTFNYYTISQTDSNGCSSSAGIYNITGVYPTYPQNIIPVGNNTLYYPTGLHHQWYFNGNPIANSDTNYYHMTQVGCYKVFSWWYNSYECGTFSLDSVCILTVETPENFAPENTISISPNPFTTETILSFSEVQENTTIKIMDMMGKEIRALNFTGTQLKIEKGEMSSGIYFVQITGRNKNAVTKKMVVE